MEGLLKYSSIFQLHIFMRVNLIFLQYIATKTTYYNRLNEEAVIRIQLSTFKAVSKEIYKNVKQYHSSHYLKNTVLFIKVCVCVNEVDLLLPV